MTTATMRGILRSAAASAPLLAALALVGLTTGASAQVTGTTGTTTTATTTSNQAIDSNFVVRRNGSIIKNGTIVFANIVDCGGTDFGKTSTDGGVLDKHDPSSFEFSATFTANVPVVELWLGVTSSENCATLASRLPTGSAGTQPPVCTFLGRDSNNTRNPKITVAGNQLFNSTTGWTNPQNLAPNATTDPCDQVKGGQTYTIYYIPLNQATTTSNGSEAGTFGVLSTLKAVFTPYTQRPDAPTQLSGQSGETEIGVSFKAPSSSMTLTKYKAYFDTTPGQGSGVVTPVQDAGASMDGGNIDAAVGSAGSSDGAVADDQPDDNANSSGGDNMSSDTSADGGASSSATASCGSGALDNNVVYEQNIGTIFQSSESSSTTVKFTNLSTVQVGTNVAVAAVSIDPAGNESPLSNPICVERVNTTGFIDACDNTPGCKNQLDSCSLQPAGKGSAWSLSLFGLAVVALARRLRTGRRRV